VRIARGKSTSGKVRLRLLTSQIVPKKEVDKKQVDDLDRALRLAGEPTIAADQSEITARVLVPGDLPDIPFDLAVQAELLSDDGQQVLATAITPAVRRKIVDPSVAIVLEGEPEVEVQTGVAPTARLTGKLRREAGFDKPVTITLAGLPEELSPPAVNVPGDASEFELPLVFPYTSPLGSLDGVRLAGETQLSAERKLKLECDVPLKLTIVAGGPPPGLFPVFEDEPTFVTALNEGDGQGSLETEDRYTGSAAYRVTPVQRYREELPGLAVQITEIPGDGEYRYLRFAWKKRGGENILLQLRGDGRWGPSRDGDGAALRYEAGPGNNPFNAAAVKVDDMLPEQWTVVTRDLYADFGAFRLDGLALTASDGDAALFDHVYLARSESELERCPRPESADELLALFEDQPEFAASLTEGGGQAEVTTDDKYSGAASIRVTPDQRYNPALPGLGVKIREHPAAGEYRYLRFAWKKQGGQIVCLQINHDGRWGPADGQPAKFRYDAGPRPGESYGAAVRIDQTLPAEWTVVTRDLFADFGEFTFTGLALSPQDGEFARFDHIYLSRSVAGLNAAAP
jgi:hypothetical protein